MTKILTAEATKAMSEYVERTFAESMGEDECWTLGTAWREAQTVFERAAVAAAIVYRVDALTDRPYRVTEERGEYADPRLCIVADALAL